MAQGETLPRMHKARCPTRYPSTVSAEVCRAHTPTSSTPTTQALSCTQSPSHEHEQGRPTATSLELIIYWLDNKR